MTVVVIMVVIMLAGLPRYLTVVEKARSAEGVEILTALCKAQKRYALENDGNFTNNINDLDLTIPQSNNFNAPTVAADGSATIVRAGRYTFSININGNLICSPANGGDPICTKMGY